MPTIVTFEQLQERMSIAIKAGDNKVIEEVASLIVKSKADRHKAEADKLQEEAKAMAGDRLKLEVSIHDAVKGLKLDSAIRKLKAKGFTLTIDRTEYPAGEPEVYITGACSLIVPTVKAAKAGGTGGNQKTKEEFGMSLDQVFEANKDLMTAEQATEYDGATNSRKWQIKTAVKKVALTQNRIAPVK